MASKKRKRQWIVGGVLGFVVLFSFMALVVSQHNPDARLERILEEVIDEYDLQQESSVEGFNSKSGTGLVKHVYVGREIDLKDEGEIISDIRDASPDWEYSGNPGLHIFNTSRPRVGSIESIVFRPYDDPWGDQTARLEVILYTTSPSFREKIQSLWPW